MRKKTGALIIVALLLSGVAAYLALNRPPPPMPETQEIAPIPPLTRVEVPPAPVAPVEPEILHPLDSPPMPEAPPETGVDADAQLLTALGTVLGKNGLALIVPEALLRHIVSTVDHLPRKYLPAAVVPLRRAQGPLMTAGAGETLSIDARNSVRYAIYTRLVQSIDSAKLASVYRQFYPLLQKTYVELGYPKAYFNDRLVLAIDDMLAAPDPEEPILLIQPKVLYAFADPELQERSAGQKIMIRIGRENRASIKAKLSEFRPLIAHEISQEAPKETQKTQ